MTKWKKLTEMIQFCSLASGSSGNCLYVETPDVAVLVDCGISGKKVIDTLKEIDKNSDKIKAVLVTHDHSDHISGIGVISRKLKIPVYASMPTMKSILNYDSKIDKYTIIDEEVFHIGDLEISVVKTSHDSPDSCGYIFQHENSKIVVMTDLGFVTNEIIKKCNGCNFAFIESNYDLKMLMYGSYPMETKRRIASEIGHLSNDDCGKLACSLANSGTRKFMLGHISSNNNMTTIAYNTVRDCLIFMGYQEKEFSLDIATKYEHSKIITID